MKTASFILTSLLLLGGCASTTITTPSGVVYRSSKDMQADEVYYEHTIALDGTETRIFQLNGAKGTASTVIDSQTKMLRAAIQAAFAAGLKGAVPGG